MKLIRCLAPSAALILTLSACTPGPAPTGGPTVSPSPTEVAAVGMSDVPTTMVTSEKPGTLDRGGVHVSMLPLTAWTGLAIAQTNARNAVLQQAAWAGAKDVRVDSRVVSSSPDLVGIALGAVTGEKRGVVTLYYQPTTNAVFTGAALVEPASWAAFVQEVQQVDGGAELAARLGSPAFPQGDAPAIGFDAKGNLVVTDGATHAVVPADKALGFLTPLGTAALGGATHPSKVAAATAIVPAAADYTGKADPASTRPRVKPGVDCSTAKCVALTFDDGPVAESEQVRKTLIEKKVPATFFTLGNNFNHGKDVTASLSAAGNEVGWHTITHRQLTGLSQADLTKEISAGPPALTPTIGYRPIFFRPPYGAHNKRVDKALADSSFANIMWTVDTKDWDKSKLQGAALEASVKSIVATEAKPGGIILMHDIHETSRAATPGVIDELLQRGFTLVTVGELPGWESYAVGSSYCAAPELKQRCW